ncbi:MAG: pirin family protein [Proteobacteria bacterium]|nr:pirin family protein [Pseudomonadota bacterium]
MSGAAIIAMAPLGFPWPTLDPFLFCAHHDDQYPAGNDVLGPQASLEGRNLGMDFEIRDGWRMYHGEKVPGFPRHPHRGFETITLARSGYIDHSDSLGAKARFGNGDAQWMTAGAGVVHSEMFPLVNRDAPNPTELFQIWLNLPAEDKMVPAYFTMFWANDIPRASFEDAEGRRTDLLMVAGALGDTKAPKPPPNSWAARDESDLAVWTIKLSERAQWTVPKSKKGVNRLLYFFTGTALTIDGLRVEPGHVIQVHPDQDIRLENHDGEAELLMLQGRPIGEPVARHGPFVMNTRDEIRQAMFDYQRTGFGGWPWETDAPVHDRAQQPFAQHADGRLERKG